MNVKVLIGAIIALIVINVFMITNYHKYKKSCSIRINSLEQAMNGTTALESNLTASIDNNNRQLGQVTARDSLGNELLLNVIFQKGKNRMLVCRFSEMYCESCIDNSIKTLLKESKNIGKDNLVFLGTYRNNKLFNRKKPLYGIDSFNTLNIGKLDLPIEDLEYPYYMVLDSSLQVLNVYIPSKGNSTKDRNYINLLIERYFK